MNPILLIIGSPASGKSTISQAITKRSSKGLHIPVNDLRTMVVGGVIHPGPEWPPELIEQLELARHTAIDMALRYQRSGFWVAIDDFWDPYSQLKAAKIANSLTLLEAGAEPQGRAELAQRMGINETYLLYLVHRADVSRLPYTSEGAVRRLWGMGYRSMAALRIADPQEYADRSEAYFAAGGKGTTFDARMSTIIGFLQDARHVPEVVRIT